MKKINGKELKFILMNQKNEIDGYHIYNNLSGQIKSKHNSSVLKKIAVNEKEHYQILKKYSGIEVRPGKIKIFLYTLCARVLGLTFTLKLMEKGEKDADNSYSGLKKKIREVAGILKQENSHEKNLLNMINESKLSYMGSVVLGLNDALVELTGALAGYTLALKNSRAIAMIGLITGIAAALSMASSEFLAKRHEGEHEKALLASIYTGIAYIITVIILVLPFFLFINFIFDLILCLVFAVLIIYLFNFYIATAKDLPFKKRFLEMTSISLIVSAVSFCIGMLVKFFMKMDI